MANQKPTQAAAWRRPGDQTEVIALPSGNSASIRQPDLLDLFANDASLSAHTEKVAEIIGMASGGLTAAAMLKGGNLPSLYAMTGAVCRAVFVEPVITPEGVEPDETQIALDWLPFKDRMAVFTHIAGEADETLPFPETPGGDGPAGPTEPEVREDAE